MSDKTARIRQLNDRLRNTFTGGRIMLTLGVRTSKDLAAVLTALKDFTEFDESNDPHSEHDFGSFEVNGERFFFKVDYYDTRCEYGSADPSDPNITTRVLTLMRADEY